MAYAMSETPDAARPVGTSAAETGLRPLRWLLHLWFRLTRGLTVGVRAAVLDADGRVFLVRHSYVPGWHLPGGGVEPGETLLQALAKELMEEGQLRIDSPPELYGVYLNTTVTNRDHIAVYVVRSFTVLGPRPPDREIVETGFFPLAALPEGTTQATRRRLQEIAEARVPDSFW
jgi:8-oxo-dGTP pyrophosphatase MutT (NUDIX family)